MFLYFQPELGTARSVLIHRPNRAYTDPYKTPLCLDDNFTFCQMSRPDPKSFAGLEEQLLPCSYTAIISPIFLGLPESVIGIYIYDHFYIL
jgi:hypothetical protein